MGLSPPPSTPGSRSATPSTPGRDSAGPSAFPESLLTASVGEPLSSDYVPHNVSDAYDSMSEAVPSSLYSASEYTSSREMQILVNTALVARIEALEAENKALKKEASEGASRVKDLAFRFVLSVGLALHYIVTWIMFMYQHLKEIN